MTVKRDLIRYDFAPGYLAGDGLNTKAEKDARVAEIKKLEKLKFGSGTVSITHDKKRRPYKATAEEFQALNARFPGQFAVIDDNQADAKADAKAGKDAKSETPDKE